MQQLRSRRGLWGREKGRLELGEERRERGRLSQFSLTRGRFVEPQPSRDVDKEAPIAEIDVPVPAQHGEEHV